MILFPSLFAVDDDLMIPFLPGKIRKGPSTSCSARSSDATYSLQTVITSSTSSRHRKRKEKKKTKWPTESIPASAILPRRNLTGQATFPAKLSEFIQHLLFFLYYIYQYIFKTPSQLVKVKANIHPIKKGFILKG